MKKVLVFLLGAASFYAMQKSYEKSETVRKAVCAGCSTLNGWKESAKSKIRELAS